MYVYIYTNIYIDIYIHVFISILRISFHIFELTKSRCHIFCLLLAVVKRKTACCEKHRQNNH